MTSICCGWNSSTLPGADADQGAGTLPPRRDHLVPGRAQEPGRLELCRAEPRMGAQPRRRRPSARPLCRAGGAGLGRDGAGQPPQDGTGCAGRRGDHDRRIAWPPKSASPPWGKRLGSDGRDLVQETGRCGRHGRDAVRAGDRQGDGRGSQPRRRHPGRNRRARGRDGRQTRCWRRSTKRGRPPPRAMQPPARRSPPQTRPQTGVSRRWPENPLT